VDEGNMTDVAIHVENLGKRYRIGERQRYKALRDTLTDAVYAPFRVAASLLNGRNGHNRSASNALPEKEFWALKDVSFDIKKSEVVGIIGRNGAGKSTLLKILSRITKPTEGYVGIHGRVGSLLEVGTGFHPELTGRENIYLNGAIIGMRKKEIDRKFDEIVAFAEVEKFINTPVKLYSSGMYVRLAFAVAAHLEPEILLVDEVLAVGDTAFQKKCLGKMGDVAKKGRTVLFVSHNIDAVCALCVKCALLQNGRLIVLSCTTDVVAQYLDTDSASMSSVEFVAGSSEAYFHSAGLYDSEGRLGTCFSMMDNLTLKCRFQVQQSLPDLEVAFSVRNFRGERIFCSPNIIGEQPLSIETAGIHTVAAIIPSRLLLPGRYFIDIALHRPNLQLYDYRERALSFEVIQPSGRYSNFPSSAFGYVHAEVIWHRES
jgi:lipopolysaccharide transport system ATP-binding protein